jgi:dipeptidyl aminopeptidase/acylaminoacyl peptidase
VAPAFSANGKGLYLLSDRGREFMALAYLDLGTSEMTYLRDDRWDAEALALTHDGTRLALALNDDGISRLEVCDVTSGWEQRQALNTSGMEAATGRGVMRELAWSRDDRKLAFTFDAAQANPDVWLLRPDDGSVARVTASARGGIPQSAFVGAELVHYPTFDGRSIPAFLFLPRDTEPRGLPAVIYVHGGPESQLRPTFNPVIQYLANQGYAVLAPNVRGSTGYGYGYQSLDDVRLRTSPSSAHSRACSPVCSCSPGQA